MKKIVSIDFIPNFEEDDFELIKQILKGYEDLKAKRKVEEELRKYFPQGEILFFNSARAALTFILKILKNIDSRREVITQAFSCLVVPNSIKFSGLKPIFVDIGDDFNFSLDDLKKKISYDSLALIIQNTFGLPAEIDEILSLAKEKNIFVIENLTHALGAKYKNTYLGNFGDITLLSFNRNKVISSIIGGALIIRSEFIIKEALKEYEKVEEFNKVKLKKLLLGTLIFGFFKKFYHSKILRKILKVLRNLKITPEMISKEEKLGIMPKDYLKKFPEELYPLLLNQLKKLEKFNSQRKKIAKIYMENLGITFKISDFSEPIFLRYPYFSSKRDEIIKEFSKENIFLGDWYFCPLAPCDAKEEIFGYEKGSCPNVEKINQIIFNLPTLINEETAYFILEKLKKWRE
jgi:dTDP-4-amino-4,6-dideoxygalactose transaminase